jgi:nitrite reductase/ring-hydroxylating ferredoxin subunit
MGFFRRLFGICATALPQNKACWLVGGKTIEVTLGDCPELARTGGALRLEGDSLPVRVLVVRRESDVYQAYVNRCTHTGKRRLDPVAGSDHLRCCSVGQSTYDATGKKVSGPAPEPLTMLPVEARDGRLFITLP